MTHLNRRLERSRALRGEDATRAEQLVQRRISNYRMLHPREEPYRWAIERLDGAFGRERVRVTPRQHHHVIKVVISGDTDGRVQEITLRGPTYDINCQPEREALLAHWISEVQAAADGARKTAG